MIPTSSAAADAPATRLDSLHHVAISVDDIAKAVDWYTTHLRCKVSYQDSTWAMLDFENVHLALVIPSQHPPHLGFVTPEAEKYGELRKHRDGTRSVYTADAAGNAVEFLAPLDSP